MRHEWTDPTEAVHTRHEWTGDCGPAYVEIAPDGRLLFLFNSETAAREILRQAERIRELEVEVERRADENVKVHDQNRATGAAILGLTALMKGWPGERIAILEAENRQLRERAEAAELRAAINADALKAETERGR